ncbi:hypothetical protein LTR51_004963 [Lithohypha guttulata]|nr:hypothetical protein LTR51_004963 [Lithohypha guttulata]
MAILGRLECRVFCNGRPSHEYEDPDGAPTQCNGTEAGTDQTVKKYIQSFSGENFLVKLEIGHKDLFQRYGVFGFDTRIDGQLADSRLVFEKHLRSDDETLCYHVEGISGHVGNSWQLQKFRFRSLQLDENVTTTNMSANAVSQLGSINVVVYRMKIEGRAPARGSNFEVPDIKISEKELKGLAQDCVTSVDAAEKTGNVRLWSTTRLPGPALATFDFRYLTIDGLKRAGVVQEPAVPDPFELLRQRQLTEEEVDDLLDIVHYARKDARKRIKQENQAIVNGRDMTPRKRTEYNSDELEEIEQPQMKMARTTPLVELE